MGIANIISMFGMAILETPLINDRVTEVLTARSARIPGPESSSGVSRPEWHHWIFKEGHHLRNSSVF